ncbi:FlgT C-terminal domain-containing protein [Marinobacter gelidimuriae]|uniref:FlgT C-terminal domain-containing protein n=1 Tax=Marinobacter gelidimuriae TaxID=2739064 RepID=UPI00035DD9C8|nr:FlgT C-terminal domain-containing protein [Marinobacter gelidimuriae]
MPFTLGIFRRLRKNGGATVNDFVLQNDDFRAYVDSYLRGMKTVSVNEHSDGAVETVVELKLEPRFRQCVASVPDTQVARYCSLPLPREQWNVGPGSAKGFASAGFEQTDYGKAVAQVYRSAQHFEALDATPELTETGVNITLNNVHPEFASGKLSAHGGQTNIQQDDIAVVW